MHDAGGKFRIGRYWLDRVPNSPNWYRFWYEPSTRKVRRKKTGTADFEQAKIILAAVVLEEGSQTEDPTQGGDPKDVRLITVCNHYWKHYSDKRPRKGDARYACNALLDYLDDALKRPARVSDLTLARIRAFMVDSHEKRGHAVSTISRNLSIVNAALNFAANGQIIIDVNDDEREVKILKYAPKLRYAYSYISQVTGAAVPTTWNTNIAVAGATSRNTNMAIEDLAAFVEDIEDDHVFRYVILALNT